MNASEGYHSVFSFADQELENVLNLFDTRVEGSHSHMEPPYSSNPMLMYQNAPLHLHQPSEMSLNLRAFERLTAGEELYHNHMDKQQKQRGGGSKSRAKGKNAVTQGIPQRFLPSDGKPTVSHSAAEKQRRDRINTLIDELRELVPIDREETDACIEDPLKRPKHIVLSDTIKYVKKTIAIMNLEGDAGKKIQGQRSFNSSENLLLRRPRENSDASSDKSERSEGLGGMVEIFVELDEQQKLTVNVVGKDRNGLLHDITKALKLMDLEIKHAIIQTRNDGNVNDIFEIERGNCSLTHFEIRNGLIRCLEATRKKRKKVEEFDDGDKRKREDL